MAEFFGRERLLPCKRRYMGSDPSASDRAARFANYFEVGCTEEEIVVRFGIRDDGGAEPSVHNTIFTTPGYARELVELIEETLRQHAALIARARSQRDGDDPAPKPVQ